MTENKPNIKFVGEKGREMTYFNNSVEGRIQLPDPEFQNKPFYHEKAGTIIKLFPKLYKKVQPKG